MLNSRKEKQLDKQVMEKAARDEVAFIKNVILVDELLPPSCWRVPQIVLSGERLYQTLVVGREPKRFSRDADDNYNMDPDFVVDDPCHLVYNKPLRMVHPLQGKYTTENVIYLYYNTIKDIAAENQLDIIDYLRQVLAHEIFHSLHFAKVKESYFQGCCKGSWPMAEVYAVDYWRGTGMQRNKVMAVREGLARIFECAWCVYQGKLEQGIKLESYLSDLSIKEPNNPYVKGLRLLRRYESNTLTKNPVDFARFLIYGLLTSAEHSAVYNKAKAFIIKDNGWEDAYTDLECGKYRIKEGVSLEKYFSHKA